MDDIKIAILRTFESTVKTLIGGSTVNSCQSSDALIEHLAAIRADIAELRKRVALLESDEEPRVYHRKVADDIISVYSVTDDDDTCVDNTNIVVDDKSTVVDIKEDMPINCVPDIVPPLVVAEERVPDIEDERADIEPAAAVEMTHEEAAVEEEDEGEEEVEDAEEEAEEAEEEAEEDAEEEEETELDEITYKGVTYYKDAENIVYTVDGDGELVEEPVGRWNDSSKTVKFFKK